MIECSIMKFATYVFLLLFAPCIAFAEMEYTTGDNADIATMTLAQKHRYISQLKSEIADLQSKISECERKTKGWRGATIFGAIGTVATGAGLAVQMSQQNAAKKQKEGQKDDKKE